MDRLSWRPLSWPNQIPDHRERRDHAHDDAAANACPATPRGRQHSKKSPSFSAGAKGGFLLLKPSERTSRREQRETQRDRTILVPNAPGFPEAADAVHRQGCRFCSAFQPPEHRCILLYYLRREAGAEWCLVGLNPRIG